MSRIEEVVGKDHDKLRELAGALGAALGAGEAGGDAAARADRLIIEVSRHEAAEELTLWGDVRRRLAEGRVLAERGLAEEQAARQLLDELRRRDPGEDGYASLVERAVAAVEEHLAHEEREVLPALVEVLAPSEDERLAAMLDAQTTHSPTRPHPRIGTAAGRQRTLGTLAGLVDRVRDLVGRRH